MQPEEVWLEACTLSCIVEQLALEDVARLARVSSSFHEWLQDLGAGTSASELRCASRRRTVSAEYRMRYWAGCQRVEEARRCMLARYRRSCAPKPPSKNGKTPGYFESCAGLDRNKHGLAGLDSRGLQGEIRRDVVRTFATRTFFAARDGQNAVAEVLLALSVAHPQIGYCQGMNLVVGALLEAYVGNGIIPNEERLVAARRDSVASADDDEHNEKDVVPLAYRSAQRAVFWLASALCSVGDEGESRHHLDNALELRELWRPGMPQLKLRVYQFDMLLKKFLPRLRAHFKAIGMMPDVLASQWFFTLFAYAIPPHWLPRCWDLVFADGWKALMRLGLARLKIASDILLEANLEEASKYFRDRNALANQCGDEKGLELLLTTSFDFKVTRTTLAELTEQFGLLLLEERCNILPKFDLIDDSFSTNFDGFDDVDLDDNNNNNNNNNNKQDTSFDKKKDKHKSQKKSSRPQQEDKKKRVEDEWLHRYGRAGSELLADAPARALRSRLAELDMTAKKDAATLRSRVESVDKDAADALLRLEKATDLLKERRQKVGELVDAKRIAAAEAARLVASHQSAVIEDAYDDDNVLPGSPNGSLDNDMPPSLYAASERRRRVNGKGKNKSSPDDNKQKKSSPSSFSSSSRSSALIIGSAFRMRRTTTTTATTKNASSAQPRQEEPVPSRHSTTSKKKTAKSKLSFGGTLLGAPVAVARSVTSPVTLAFNSTACFSSTMPFNRNKPKRAVVRDDLARAQGRAARAEKELRTARSRLNTAAHDFLIAQADLDDARDQKRAVESQLMHVLDNATEKRRTIFTDVVADSDSPDLKLVRRFSEHPNKPKRHVTGHNMKDLNKSDSTLADVAEEDLNEDLHLNDFDLVQPAMPTATRIRSDV